MRSTNINVPPLHVVVVEDDPSLLRLYRLRINAAPFPIRLSAFGKAHDALNHLVNDQADLIIVDMHLPDLQGHELIDAIYSFFSTYGTKVIVVSGRDEADIRASYQLPEDVSVFGKPVPFDYLLQKLQQMHDFKLSLQSEPPSP